MSDDGLTLKSIAFSDKHYSTMTLEEAENIISHSKPPQWGKDVIEWMRLYNEAEQIVNAEICDINPDNLIEIEIIKDQPTRK